MGGKTHVRSRPCFAAVAPGARLLLDGEDEGAHAAGGRRVRHAPRLCARSHEIWEQPAAWWRGAAVRVSARVACRVRARAPPGPPARARRRGPAVRRDAQGRAGASAKSNAARRLRVSHSPRFHAACTAQAPPPPHAGRRARTSRPGVGAARRRAESARWTACAPTLGRSRAPARAARRPSWATAARRQHRPAPLRDGGRARGPRTGEGEPGKWPGAPRLRLMGPDLSPDHARAAAGAAGRRAMVAAAAHAQAAAEKQRQSLQWKLFATWHAPHPRAPYRSRRRPPASRSQCRRRLRRCRTSPMRRPIRRWTCARCLTRRFSACLARPRSPCAIWAA